MRKSAKKATRRGKRSQRRRSGTKSAAVDKITLDLIENALRNARYEMDTVLFRSAMSPVIREQHDGFPMICTPDGRMVVGQFGSYISGFISSWKRGIYEGDVFLMTLTTNSELFRLG